MAETLRLPAEDDDGRRSDVCGGSCCVGDADDVEIVVGECIPDGQGGCQRARATSSCCVPSGAANVPDACCAEDSEKGCGVADACCSDCGDGDASEEECKDSCCAGDNLSVEAPERKAADAESVCCSDCGRSSADDNHEDDGCKDGCCVGEDRSVEAPERKGRIDDECCSDCGPSSSDDACKEVNCKDMCCTETVSIAHSLPAGSPQLSASKTTSADACCTGHPVIRRRRVVHQSANRAQSSEGAHTRAHKPRRAHDHSKCGLETTFSRFFEAACCCLVDWRVKPRRAPHHHHHHPKPEPERKRRAAAAPVPSASVPTDAELGATRTRTLVLSVQGMDCPSCARKLTRALLTLPSVADVKVNTFTDTATLDYKEGLVFPPNIARRASELTGFTCAVLEEQAAGDRTRVMRVSVDAKGAGNAWEKGLPPGVVVQRVKEDRGAVFLDVEYDSGIVKPRAVLAAFAPWDGAFIPTPKPTASAQAVKELYSLLRRTTVSAILCIPILIFAWAPLVPHPTVYGACSLALATLILVYVATPLYSSALRALFLQHILDMDLLVVLSSTIAYIFSAVAYFTQVAGAEFATPFFETPALLITLITLGRLISAYARRRATSALDDVRTLQADTVLLVQEMGAVEVLPAELVHRGDVLRVAADSVVPTDGVVVRGASLVDESSITGESMPVEKTAGAKLTAGTLNQSGVLDMAVDRVPADNTISDIGRLVAQVQDSRLPVEDLADKAASYLAPFILTVSVIVFVVWIVVGLCVRHQSSNTAGIAALKYTISVLVISCPCALVLCVPMVVVISAAVAAKEGVLFKSVNTVQHVKDIRIAVFDKTGTLTRGQLAVMQSHVADEESTGAMLGLLSGSRHPVAQAVSKFLQATHSDIPPVPLRDTVSLPGLGIEAKNGAVVLRGGSPSWLGLHDHPVIREMEEQALTLFAVTSGADLVAAFGLVDSIRPSAREAIRLLERHGCEVHIVSGDTQPSVSALAASLDIPADRAVGGCRPETKLARVVALQNGGTRRAKVMFVGDGTNDCLALAQADVGVSLSSGTDIALSAADVVVLDLEAGADLARSLRVVFDVSRGAVRRIMVNFIWSFVYNVLAVLLAAGAFVHVRVAPEYAGLGEVVSVVPVVLIAWSMWFLKQ